MNKYQEALNFLCDHAMEYIEDFDLEEYECGGRVHPFDGDLYCKHCGQALDWRDDQ